jgi:hypothetical protein
LSRAAEVVGDGAGGHGLESHQGEDGPARGVGYGLEDVSAEVHLCSYLTANIRAVIWLRKFIFARGSAAAAALSKTATQISNSASRCGRGFLDLMTI